MANESAGQAKSILAYMTDDFTVSFDEKARRWLDEHPSKDALVIAYQDTRC